MSTIDPAAMDDRSKRPSTIIWLIALTVILFIGWASVAWVDEIVRGPGEIVSSSKPQIIQNLEGGILAALYVAEGDTVEPGDVLARLQGTQYQSQVDDLESQIAALEVRKLRLEAEMSVVDEEAKRNMAADIDQLDAIIDKFMDYARPGEVELVPVHLSSVVDKAISQFRDTKRIRITAKLPIDTRVMADETELSRVLTNLFENARRYGRNTYTGVTNVEVNYTRSGSWVVLSVRDHGPGVAVEKLAQLTTPFFRGDAARTAATGAGLGLAIVEKALQRMGGGFELANAQGGGLVAHIKLKRAA